MHEILKKIGLLAALVFSAFALAACSDDDAEDALDDFGDAVEDAAEETGDAVEEAADNVEDATN